MTNSRLHRSPEITDMAEKPKAEPTSEEKMDAWGKRMDAMCDQMDAFMKKHSKRMDKRSDDDDEGEGDPEQMASDDSRGDEGDPDDEGIPSPGARRRAADRKADEALAKEQQRADACAQHWGRRALRPLDGDSFRSYRIRTLNAEKQFSPRYRKVDLHEIKDRHALDAAAVHIRSDSIHASRDNSMHPAGGRLREIIDTDRTGRQISTFFGPVSETLAPFRSQVFRVRRINNQPSGYGYVA
jgi:hypothetical protein